MITVNMISHYGEYDVNVMICDDDGDDDMLRTRPGRNIDCVTRSLQHLQTVMTMMMTVIVMTVMTVMVMTMTQTSCTVLPYQRRPLS